MWFSEVYLETVYPKPYRLEAILTTGRGISFGLQGLRGLDLETRTLESEPCEGVGAGL